MTLDELDRWSTDFEGFQARFAPFFARSASVPTRSADAGAAQELLADGGGGRREGPPADAAPTVQYTVGGGWDPR